MRFTEPAKSLLIGLYTGPPEVCPPTPLRLLPKPPAAANPLVLVVAVTYGPNTLLFGLREVVFPNVGGVYSGW